MRRNIPFGQDSVPQNPSRDSRSPNVNAVLQRARSGVQSYLESSRQSGQLATSYYEAAVRSTLPNLERWLCSDALDKISPRARSGIVAAIDEGLWEQLVNAYVRDVKFGTGGIRALMGFDREAILTLKQEGIDAPILKGPNTFNNIVVLTCATGLARFLKERSARKPQAVVGFDSRLQGSAFAAAIAAVLLAEGLQVYLFDEAVAYPEVTYAIPAIGADVGVFISASHNDFRYNGFNLSGPNGAQIPYQDRDILLDRFIRRVTLDSIPITSLNTLDEHELKALHFLGGNQPLQGVDYYGRESNILDIHSQPVDHVKSFMLRTPDELGEGSGLKIVYAAFNGAGRRAVPRILNELGFNQIERILSLDPLDGLFPAFKSDPGEEQQPDPGDPRSAKIALSLLRSENGPFPWSDADILIGTDPDADRCGLIVRPSANLGRVFAR